MHFSTGMNVPYRSANSGCGKYRYASYIGVRHSTYILHPCMHTGINYQFILPYPGTMTVYGTYSTIDFIFVFSYVFSKHVCSWNVMFASMVPGTVSSGNIMKMITNYKPIVLFSY